MDILLLFLALGVLMVLAMRGVPIFIATLVTSLLLAFSQGMGLYDTMMNAYAAGTGRFVGNYVLMFGLGTVFGKLVEISGAADVIAATVIEKFGTKYVVAGIAVATSILLYGGVSVFVAMFPMYALALPMFKQADIPRRLFPAAYLAGASWVCTAPFSPSITNVLPARVFETDLGAIPVEGMISSVLLFLSATIITTRVVRKAQEAGEGFTMPPGETYKIREYGPPFLLALFPLAFLLIILNVFKVEVEMTLLLTTLLCIVCYGKWLALAGGIKGVLNELRIGLVDSSISLTNVGATIGFGTVIAAAPGFTSLVNLISDWKNLNPVIGIIVMTSILVAACGSQSGGLGIVSPILKDIYVPLGVSPEALHRISCFASNGLDTLPHNGFVVTVLNLTKCSYKEAYPMIFVNTVVLTLVVQLGVGVVLMMITGAV